MNWTPEDQSIYSWTVSGIQTDYITYALHRGERLLLINLIHTENTIAYNTIT